LRTSSEKWKLQQQVITYYRPTQNMPTDSVDWITLPSTASGCTTAVACMNLKPSSTVANAAVPIAQSACSYADSGESDFVSNSPYYHALAVSIFLHEDASPA
jgi:hypothetical protein